MVKTKFGQHFLIDKRILNKEIAAAELKTSDVVLEIGPGKGMLTKELAKRCELVIAVELDQRLLAYLQKTLPDNVLLINNDILNIRWENLPSFSKVVANLPFQISSPFTFKLLETEFEKAILIYQKEFAQRMIAIPGSKQYSRLSVGIAYKARCNIITHISPSSFSPKPEVFSSLVELIPFSQPPFEVIDESFFFTITTLFFSHRRKQIKTIVKNSFSKEIAEKIHFGSKRIEQLTPNQIGWLCNELYPYQSQMNNY